MKLVVCIKQVPSSNEVRLDPETKTIIRDGRQSVINPFDAHAVEAAVSIREQLGGEITVLSMGIPATEALLRDTVARGADRIVLLSDRAFAGADTLATSYTLSRAIGQLDGFDLILCGKMAVDGDTAQIGPELAEQLGIPHISDVCGILEVGERSIKVKRSTERGWQIVSAALPALITVTREANNPRLATLAGIRRSLEAPYRRVDAAALGADGERIGLSGSPTQVVKTFVPVRERESVPLAGSPAEQAAAICALKEEICR